MGGAPTNQNGIQLVLTLPIHFAIGLHCGEPRRQLRVEVLRLRLALSELGQLES